MQPSQADNQSRQQTQINSPELAQRIDSDIKAKKLRLVEELEDSQHDDSRRRRPKFSQSKIKKEKKYSKFAPFRSRALRITGKRGCSSFTGCESSFYNKKHNLIIICPAKSALYFYDATTLLPPEGREVLPLGLLGYDNVLTGISFCSETDTFLFACSFGDLHAYDFNKKILKTVQKVFELASPAVTFINSTYYAFSNDLLYEILIGNLEDGSLMNSGSGEARMCLLEKLEKKDLLLSALANGVVRIYRTNRLPKLSVICSARAHKERSDTLKVEKIILKRKDFMITSGSVSGIMKVWHFVKGKMRLLKTINTGDITICSCIYLANYKMVVTTHDNESIKFFGVFSGKLRYEYSSNQARFKDAFFYER